MLNEIFNIADAPAAAVADKFTSIKISAVNTIPLGGKTLVKIITNQGIVGWGEIPQVPPAVAWPVMAAAIGMEESASTASNS